LAGCLALPLLTLFLTHPLPFVKTRIPVVTLALAIVAVVVPLVPGWPAHLEFDRVAIAQGEWWRGLTGHLTHFESNHLAWDVGALLLLGSAAERENRRRLVWTLLGSAAAISTAVWWWQPHFGQYRGLSGVDSALFGLVAGALVRRRRFASTLVGSLALVGIAGKSALELATGSAVFATAGNYAPVPLAHLVGLAMGLAMAWRWLGHSGIKARRKKRDICNRASGCAPSQVRKSDVISK